MTQNNLNEAPIYTHFIDVVENDEGALQQISFHDIDNFNFAYDIVDEIARKSPDKLAMLYLSVHGEEHRFTFREMMEESNRTANYFMSLGIKKGDRVMLVLKRHYQFWFSILALHKIGAIAIPTANLLVRHDFRYRFKAADVNAIVCTADGIVRHEVDRAISISHFPKIKIIVGGQHATWHDFDSEYGAFSPEFERPQGENATKITDPMAMFFTSGTTSYPKITTHNYSYALAHFVTAKYWHTVDPDGLHFTISDTGWAKSLWGKLYGQWICEAPIFTYDFDNFNAEEILELIEKYQITTLCAPPTVFRVMVHMKLEKYNLSSLQRVTTAGEALNPEVYDKFYKATGKQLIEGFGQTETTLTLGTLIGTEPHSGSMGKPSPLYQIDLMKSDGTFCEDNETGEIVIKLSEHIPEGLFAGYYNDVEMTSKVWYDGYYHTGDTAYRDGEGYFWYVGRVDDLIKAAGYRVGPFEIESEIMKLPYIVECAVTSIPDRTRGQAIKATCVLKKGIEPTKELKNKIFAFIQDNVASYKQPKKIEFVDELPKTVSGKIKRSEIKAKDWVLKST